METYSTLLAICAGNSPVPGEFPAQRPVTRALMFPLIYVWINGWVNNREAGDLRLYHTHYYRKTSRSLEDRYLCWAYFIRSEVW